MFLLLGFSCHLVTYAREIFKLDFAVITRGDNLFRKKLYVSWKNFEEKESELEFWRTVDEDVNDFLKSGLT